MNERDLFSAGIRIVGLLSFGRGFLDLISVLSVQLGLSTTSVLSDDYYRTLRLGLVYLVVGLYLMRGAKVLIKFAFPTKPILSENLTNAEDLSAPQD